MEVVEALVRCGGVARTADLLLVVSRHALRRAVENGDIVRDGHGHYRLAACDEHVAAAARLAGASSLLSAALAHGWKVKLPPESPQVVVPRGRKVDPSRRSGVDLRWGSVSRSELAAGVTEPVRTVLDCARQLPFDAALAVADSALRDGVPRTDLLLACERLPRSGRNRAFRVVELATPLAANPFESVLRAVLTDVPDTCFEPQVWIGNVGRADLVERRKRVAVEGDSFEFHSDSAAFARDMVRYNGFVAEDHRVLRFGWRHAMFDQDYVRAVVTAVTTPNRLSVRRCATCGAA